MTSALFISIALQLSVVLLFRRLSRSVKKPKLWITVALGLMTIPFSAAVYQLIEMHRAYIPLPELLSFMGSFLAILAFLGLVPTAYLLIRSRDGQVHTINESLQAEIAQRKQAEDQLRALSFTDELTGLFNRRGLLTMGAQQLKIARRTRRRLLLTERVNENETLPYNI